MSVSEAQRCPLGVDESTWKAERSVLEKKEAVEEAKADLKAVRVGIFIFKFSHCSLQVRYMIARLLVDFTKEESDTKLSRRLQKTMSELDKFEEQERQLVEVYYQARQEYLVKLQAWRMRLTAVLSKQEDVPPQHLGANGAHEVVVSRSWFCGLVQFVGLCWLRACSWPIMCPWRFGGFTDFVSCFCKFVSSVMASLCPSLLWDFLGAFIVDNWVSLWF